MANCLRNCWNLIKPMSLDPSGVRKDPKTEIISAQKFRKSAFFLAKISTLLKILSTFYWLFPKYFHLQPSRHPSRRQRHINTTDPFQNWLWMRMWKNLSEISRVKYLVLSPLMNAKLLYFIVSRITSLFKWQSFYCAAVAVILLVQLALVMFVCLFFHRLN